VAEGVTIDSLEPVDELLPATLSEADEPSDVLEDSAGFMAGLDTCTGATVSSNVVAILSEKETRWLAVLFDVFVVSALIDSTELVFLEENIIIAVLYDIVIQICVVVHVFFI
jgi:hypothetical protein